MSIDVEIQLEDDGFRPGDESAVTALINTAAQHAGVVSGEVVIRFVDSAEMRDLNSQFRNKDGVTNVLSFPYEDPPGIDPLHSSGLLGDIVICADVVSAEASEYGLDFDSRLAHLVVHGFLHLCGHDDVDPAQAAKMEAAESHVLQSLGMVDPWQEARTGTGVT